ncbi:hypothetical protein [Pseudophaeobacter flagellatus]|uniref:hypothetical protein n=1 Tax=Pseudophaeobacter flagellatus TaxID=2899119 RepID=UPI001E4526CA|nr:hypothetical protein [Pseudophaeobacter flagellatus]MCD9150137.1 hypothetical protein [Pseudophaeobacter flagellatus]
MPKSASLLPALVLAAMAGLVTPPVMAKPLSRMLAQSPMTPGDFDAMRAAEAALYDHAGVKVGSSVKWRNPETASYGMVKVIGKQGNCLAMTHTAHPKGASPARELMRKFCQASSGKWLLTE